MIRKQIYIQKHQQAQLRRLARARGVSEAGVIRQAIDRELAGASSEAFVPDPTAWEEIRKFIEAQRAPGPLEQRPRQWKRDDLYEERPG